MKNNGKLIQLLFSPTGNTKKIADSICNAINEEYSVIDLSAEVEEQTLGNDDVIVAAVPVFGGRVPKIILDRIGKVKASGNKAIAVVVYGNRDYDDALLELSDTLKDSGCKIIAAGAFIAEHSIVRTVAANRPNQKDFEYTKNFARRISDKLEDDEIEEIRVPGNPKYKDKKPSPCFIPAADKTCNACGTCVNACPTHAISIETPRIASKSCIGCMRCVSVCPIKARKLPDTIVFSAKMMLSMLARKKRLPEIYI